MNNIDKIFSKLKDSQIQAPDIWNKLESELNNPSKDIVDNFDKISALKNVISNPFLKTFGIITVCAVIGVGTYIAVDNYTNKKELTSIQIKKEIPSTIVKTHEFNNDKTIIVEKTNQINNSKYSKNINIDNFSTIFKVNDENSIEIQNNNYSINSTSFSEYKNPEIKINHVNIDSSLLDEKISPIVEKMPDFEPSNVITPNGDGINDVFFIKNVEKFPDNSLVIFDDRGKIIFKCRNYKNNFKAVNIPIGTYFYKFEYRNIEKKEIKPGSITVM